jgi:anti-sigma B factor antagonist
MNVQHRDVDGITVVDLSGRLDSAVAGEVMDKLNALVNGGATKLVINLKDLAYISSAGLRSILVAAKLVQTSNGSMRLCEPTGRVSQILHESGFAQLLKIDSHEAQSIAGLRGDAPSAG